MIHFLRFQCGINLTNILAWGKILFVLRSSDELNLIMLSKYANDEKKANIQSIQADDHELVKHKTNGIKLHFILFVYSAHAEASASRNLLNKLKYHAILQI